MTVAGAAFQDGLGERRQTNGGGNQLLDLVIVHEELGGAAGFEAALRQRAGELASFQHAAFPRLRGVGRLSKTPSRIVVATDHVSGIRLSDLLLIAERRLIPLEYEGAIGLVQQLLHAMAALHESVPHVSHGALAPERLMIAADSRLMVVDHVFGAAIERLGYDPQRCWKELRVALPFGIKPAALDRRTDVTQLGVVALALLVGRSLADDEYPAAVADMIEGLNAVSANGLEMLPAQVKTWMRRVMQLADEGNFATAVEAKAEFDATVTVDESRARKVLTAFVAECQISGKGATAVSASTEKSAPAEKAIPIEKLTPPAPIAPPVVAIQPEPSKEPASAPPKVVPLAPGATSLAAFSPSSEAAKEESAPLQVRKPAIWNSGTSQWRNRVAAAAAVVVAVATAGTFAVRSYARVPPTGVLVVNTNPDGVETFIDGKKRGSTPLTLELPAGDHTLSMTTGDQTRTMPVKITAGGHVAQFVDFPKASPVVGQLNIRTDPAGATVSVDGQRRGTSPLLIEGLTPGTHTVVLQNALSSVTEQVTIEPGATAALVVPLSAPQGVPVSGWVAVNSPVEVQLFEDGRLVGSSRSDRIMMSVGENNLQIINETLGYRSTRVIQVAPGKVSGIRIDVPKGSMALNAAPWAEVFVNGDRVGETPIGNVTVPIGVHDVVFRHPELGEQRHSVTVTLNGPARVSVDMRKRQ